MAALISMEITDMHTLYRSMQDGAMQRNDICLDESFKNEIKFLFLISTHYIASYKSTLYSAAT